MKDTPTKLLCDRGFTLLEVVIALGLIAVALLSVFHTQISTLDLQSEARFITTASQLIQARVSQLRSEASVDEGTFSGDFGDQFPEFKYSGEIRRVSGTGLYRVDLKVLSAMGESGRSLNMETYLYRPRR